MREMDEEDEERREFGEKKKWNWEKVVYGFIQEQSWEMRKIRQ